MTDLPSSLPGIDVATGLPRVAGNKKLYVKLLRHVAAEAPSTKEKLAAAVAAGNAKELRELAHSLKGSSANLSLTEVTAASEQLELAAKAEDMAGAATFLKELEVALDAYVAVVNSLEAL